MFEAASEIAAEFTVRVCLATLPQGLTMITYKIWKLSRTGFNDIGALPVIAGEPVRCCQPDCVVSYLMHALGRWNPRRTDLSAGPMDVVGPTTAGTAAQQNLQFQQAQSMQQQSLNVRFSVGSGPPAAVMNSAPVAGDGSSGYQASQQQQQTRSTFSKWVYTSFLF